MVLAQRSSHLHWCGLLLLWRYSERIRAVDAAGTSFSPIDVTAFLTFCLQYKEFQVGDVAANLLGSSLGLYIAYHLERYYRHRREVRHLVTSCAAVGIG